MSLFNIDLEKWANSIVLPKSDYKLVSYPILRNQFKDLEQVSHDDIILGASIVRSWAGVEGRSVEYDKEYLEDISDLLNRCYNEDLAFFDIEDICVFFGSEKAGTTMLNFLNPYSYPIYSPEIPNILYDYVSELPLNQRVYFQTYIEDCQQMSSLNMRSCDKITNIASNKLREAGYSYSVEIMRALEMCILYGNTDKAKVTNE